MAELTPSADAPPLVPGYELLRCIGRGSYGEVWLARDGSGGFRAVKVVYRKTFEHDRPFERELSILAARSRAGETAFSDAVVKETLRLRPVVQLVPRRLLRDVELAGRTIPATRSPISLTRSADVLSPAACAARSTSAAAVPFAPGASRPSSNSR